MAVSVTLVAGTFSVPTVEGEDMSILLLRSVVSAVRRFGAAAGGSSPGNLDVRTAGLRLGGDAAPARCSGSLVGERAPAGESVTGAAVPRRRASRSWAAPGECRQGGERPGRPEPNRCSAPQPGGPRSRAPDATA